MVCSHPDAVLPMNDCVHIVSALDLVGKQFVDISQLTSLVPELEMADHSMLERIYIEGTFAEARA